MKAVKQGLAWLDKHLEECIIFPFLMLILIMLFIEVVRRYFFSNTSPYVDEIARTMFIWVVYIGVPYAVRMNRNIVIDLLPENLPATLDVPLKTTVNVLMLGFFLLIAYYSINVLKLLIVNKTITDAMELPQVYFMAVIPIGFLGGVLRTIQNIVLTYTSSKRTDIEGSQSEQGENTQ